MVSDSTYILKSRIDITSNQKSLATKECLAVLTMLYKENGAVSCVGSGFLSDWALYAKWSVGG